MSCFNTPYHRVVFDPRSPGAAHPGRRRSAPLIAAAVLLILTAAGPSAAETLRLVVERDRITAGALARVIPAWGAAPPDTVVGYAPRPGIRRRVRLPELLRWARKADIEVEGNALPSELVIERHMRRLDLAVLRGHLLVALGEHFQVSPEDLTIEFPGSLDPLVPAGDLTFSLATPPARLNQVAPLTLQWKDAGGRTGRLRVQASVAIIGTLASARRDLPAGAELRPGDFHFRREALPGTPERFEFTPADIGQARLRRPLRAGEALDRRMLRKYETIRRGDIIQLRVRSGSIVLQTPVRAEQGGSVGDAIVCRNIESGRRVTATIAGPKFAEVVLSP